MHVFENSRDIFVIPLPPSLVQRSTWVMVMDRVTYMRMKGESDARVEYIRGVTWLAETFDDHISRLRLPRTPSLFSFFFFSFFFSFQKKMKSNVLTDYPFRTVCIYATSHSALVAEALWPRSPTCRGVSVISWNKRQIISGGTVWKGRK